MTSTGPRQPRLFAPAVLPPRRPRVVRMRQIDAGANDCVVVGKPYMGHFACKTCGLDAGWHACSGTELRRGLPCRRCNPPAVFAALGERPVPLDDDAPSVATH